MYTNIIYYVEIARGYNIMAHALVVWCSRPAD